jgi:DNA-binding transcriptional ArsR family regulator
MCKDMHVLLEKQLTREEAANKILGVIDSEFFKALAEPVRVELIKVLLLHGPADINSISKHMPQDRSVISKHLQILFRADLLNCEKDGRHRIYSLKPEAFVGQLEKIFTTVQKLVACCCPPVK